MDTFATCFNNIGTTLASPHTSGDGSLVVTDAGGISLGSGQWIRVTLVRKSDWAHTIFRCTTISGNTLSGLTVIEGTSDMNAIALDLVELRITAGHFSDIHGNLLYTSGSPVTAPVGGITAGQTFTDVPLITLIDQLLHPYQAPAFSSFAITGATDQEAGQTFSGSKTFTWGTTNSSNVQSNSIQISDTTASSVLASGLANSGSTSISISVTKSSPATNVWTIQGTNTQSATFTATTTVSWYYRLYYGTSGSSMLDASGILALSGNLLTSSIARTYSYGTGNYKFLCYPTSFGGASSFKDASTNLNVAMADSSDDASLSNTQNGFSYALVSVTNTYGVTTNYRVYRTKNVLGGSINIIVT